MTTTDRHAAAAHAPATCTRRRPPRDVGAVAVVYPGLAPATARAFRDAGVTPVLRAGDMEIWVRRPGR